MHFIHYFVEYNIIAIVLIIVRHRFLFTQLDEMYFCVRTDLSLITFIKINPT